MWNDEVECKLGIADRENLIFTSIQYNPTTHGWKLFIILNAVKLNGVHSTLVFYFLSSFSAVLNFMVHFEHKAIGLRSGCYEISI